MTPANIPFDNLVAGNQWLGVQLIGPVLINGVSPSTALASVRMAFRKAPDDITPAYVLATTPQAGQGSITINNASTWSVTIPEQPLPLAPGNWVWAIQFVDTLGTISTLFEGSLTVLPNIARATTP